MNNESNKFVSNFMKNRLTGNVRNSISCNLKTNENKNDFLDALKI